MCMLHVTKWPHDWLASPVDPVTVCGARLVSDAIMVSNACLSLNQETSKRGCCIWIRCHIKPHKQALSPAHQLQIIQNSDLNLNYESKRLEKRIIIIIIILEILTTLASPLFKKCIWVFWEKSPEVYLRGTGENRVQRWLEVTSLW